MQGILATVIGEGDMGKLHRGVGGMGGAAGLGQGLHLQHRVDALERVSNDHRVFPHKHVARQGDHDDRRNDDIEDEV